MLEDPGLVAFEIERRMREDPERIQQERSKKDLHRELKKNESSRNKLLDAYTEGDCLSLEDLQKRMRPLAQQRRRIERELRTLENQASYDEAVRQGQLTLEGFAEILRQSSQEVTIAEKQRVVRSLIDEIVIEHDSIRIKHCIPIGSKMGEKSRIGPLQEKQHQGPPGQKKIPI